MSRLRFEAPAREWLEALPLGDGTLGAMCFGDAARPAFRLNHGTGWSGGPVRRRPGESGESGQSGPVALERLRDAIAASDHAEADRLARLFQGGDTATYLPLGELVLAGGPAQDAPDYERLLDLATAVHTVRAGRLVHETFLAAGVLVHRITGPEAERRAFHPELSTPLRVLAHEQTADTATLTVRFPTSARDGELEWADGELSVTAAIAARLEHHAGESVLALAAVTDFTSPLEAPHGRVEELRSEASARIDTALARGWRALLDDHLRTHAELWQRTELALDVGEPSATVPAAIARGDAAELTQLQFDYGRYLLIAAARPGGLPPTLQGLWNAQLAPPWRSNYTININTEMNHWAAAVTRLPECVAPLLDHLEALAVTGAETARRLYGARGWVAHHNTDAWAYAGQAGEGADSPSWSFWPFGGVWLVLTASELLDFGVVSARDRERLARLVAGCADFLADWLVDGDDGALTTRPSTSPENEFALPGGGVGALATDATMDLTLARAIFACDAELNADRKDGAGAVLDRLPAALPVADDGTVREWGADERAADPHHRHLSHLVGVYPGTQQLTAAERAAVARTLEQRGDDSTGWSLIWKACLWARLGRGDKVDDLLALSRRSATEPGAATAAWRGGLYPNLFAAHPPFQIDANRGFPAALAEALLQSHRGVVELLPALPPSLPGGRARGLLARPGVVVDLAWSGGELVEVSLRTEALEQASVVIDYAGARRAVTVTRTPTRLAPPDFVGCSMATTSDGKGCA